MKLSLASFGYGIIFSTLFAFTFSLSILAVFSSSDKESHSRKPLAIRCQQGITISMNTLYSKARIAKDTNFDGKFFFAVNTTGIFCRPSCPSPVANEENVQYFNTMFEALEAGFRPCRRCRPDITVEYYNGNVVGTAIVRSALQCIYDGYLSYHSIPELAAEFGVSERHLRKLFVDNLGVPPSNIARYHKALFAKKLLLYSDESITDIAFSAGFGSLRQFNDVFKSVFHKTPTEMRAEHATAESTATLLLPYDSSFNFAQVLQFMTPRAMAGIELLSNDSYSRTFRTQNTSGYFTVTDNPQKSALELRIHCDDIRCYMAVHNKVRRLFDLDTDFATINATLGQDPLLAQGMVNNHVPRLPVAFDPFEFVIRAILGQQISVKAATTLAARIAEQANIHTNEDFPEGLTYFFPTPGELLQVNMENLGITKTRQSTLRIVTQAILDGAIELTPNQSMEEFVRRFTALKGIGPWTAHYVGMRGLGMHDSFPASDLGVIKALSNGDTKPTEKTILTRAEAWRPYRTYATLCLWNIGQQDP